MCLLCLRDTGLAKISPLVLGFKFSLANEGHQTSPVPTSLADTQLHSALLSPELWCCFLLKHSAPASSLSMSSCTVKAGQGVEKQVTWTCFPSLEPWRFLDCSGCCSASVIRVCTFLYPLPSPCPPWGTFPDPREHPGCSPSLHFVPFMGML